MGAAFIDPATGDFPAGSIPYVSGNDLICQRLKTCLSLLRGESCFYPDDGIDILNPAFRRQSNAPLLVAYYRPLILAVPGIERIVSFDISFEGTEARYDVTVSLEDGELVQSEGILNGL